MPCTTELAKIFFSLDRLAIMHIFLDWHLKYWHAATSQYVFSPQSPFFLTLLKMQLETYLRQSPVHKENTLKPQPELCL